jgi:hypothetical protein
MSRERLTDRLVTAAAEDPKKKKKEEGLHRELDGFDYDKSKAKILKDALHNMNVALGTLMSAFKDLAILRGSDITPDGKIGGRGFIMEFREIKSIVNKSIEDLSNVTDSIADELTNPKWNLKEKEKEVVEKEQEKVDDQKENLMDQKPVDAVKDPSQEVEQYKDEPGKVFEEVIDGKGKKEVQPEGIQPGDVRDASFLTKYHEMLGENAADKVASVLSKRVLASITIKGK